MNYQIESVFTVTILKTGKQEEIIISGYGQKAVNLVRKEYPRFTKIVLDGFNINGNFVPLYIK